MNDLNIENEIDDESIIKDKLKEQLGESSFDYLFLYSLMEIVETNTTWKLIEDGIEIVDGKIKKVFFNDHLYIDHSHYVKVDNDKIDCYPAKSFHLLFSEKIKNGVIIFGEGKNPELHLEYFINETEAHGFFVCSYPEWATINTGILKKIYGSMSLSEINVEIIGELEEITGNFIISPDNEEIYPQSKILFESLGNIKKIGGNLDLNQATKVKNLGNLEEIGGNIYINGADICSLGNLKIIGGDADFGLNLENLGNLEKVGGDLGLNGTDVSSIGNLKEVGGNLNLDNCDFRLQKEVNDKIESGDLIVKGDISFGGITSIENLTDGVKVYGNMRSLKMVSMEKIKEVTGNISFGSNKYLKDLGQLEKVGGDFDINHTLLANIGNLKEVGGNLNIEGCNLALQKEVNDKIANGQLVVKGVVSFGGNTEELENFFQADIVYGNIGNSNIKSIGCVKEVTGNVNFEYNTSLKKLGNLEIIGGTLNISSSELLSIGKLKKVGGGLYIQKCNPQLEKEVNDKIANGQLIVDGIVSFGGEESDVEELLKSDKIYGHLSIYGTETVSFIIKLLPWIFEKREILGNFSLNIGGDLINSMEYFTEIIKEIENTDFNKNSFTDGLKEHILNYFGTPGERNKDILELTNAIGKIIIGDYITLIDSKMGEIDINQDNIAKLLRDREDKNSFFESIFGKKLVDTIWDR